jgi:hypothetical protein
MGGMGDLNQPLVFRGRETQKHRFLSVSFW